MGIILSRKALGVSTKGCSQIKTVPFMYAEYAVLCPE